MNKYYNKAHSLSATIPPCKKRFFLLEDDYLLSESVKEFDLLKM
ncbi:hypothetical protein [Helicobacter pylori]|nr:hypothetical protein [Helicobacter pylori]